MRDKKENPRRDRAYLRAKRLWSACLLWAGIVATAVCISSQSPHGQADALLQGLNKYPSIWLGRYVVKGFAMPEIT